MSRRDSIASLRDWLLTVTHAALVVAADRVSDLLRVEDEPVEAVRADMRLSILDQMAPVMFAAELTDEGIEAQIAAWKAIS